ncbi:MAG: hypothetical protein PHC75_09080 [Burkholderiales bacterium]|nr:hypothetical protein [Burkholderiales bacterium]
MIINIYVTLLILILLVFGFLWIIKNYFQKNMTQFKNRNGKLAKSNLSTSVAASDTITEINNALSKKKFDGVNRNPEHYAKSNESLQNSNSKFDKGQPDLANEVINHQANDKSR